VNFHCKKEKENMFIYDLIGIFTSIRNRPQLMRKSHFIKLNL